MGGEDGDACARQHLVQWFSRAAGVLAAGCDSRVLRNGPRRSGVGGFLLAKVIARVRRPHCHAVIRVITDEATETERHRERNLKQTYKFFSVSLYLCGVFVISEATVTAKTSQ